MWCIMCADTGSHDTGSHDRLAVASSEFGQVIIVYYVYF